MSAVRIEERTTLSDQAELDSRGTCPIEAADACSGAMDVAGARRAAGSTADSVSRYAATIVHDPFT